MNLLTAEHITHSYTERLLFDDVSFSLNEGEKVGIIGVNGTGKSTLLKIISGIVIPDEGTVVKGNNLTICYLPQTPEFTEDDTVITAALSGCSEQESWEKEPEAKNMLTRLGILDFSQPVNQLSGGQRKRIALVRTLLSGADILVLDEPTNHLDSAMAEWLEQYLQNFRGALVMITHDRYFLDSVVTRIVELERGKLYSYSDSYLGYLALKEERREMELATERKRQSLLRVEIQWMMRGARARSTKQKAHIARYEALKDVQPPAIDEKLEMASVASRLGRTTVELEGISKSFGDPTLVRDFSYIFLRNDRIGIVGANGCGKSTLMKIINGVLEPDSGSLVIGQTVKMGYFSQENEAMDNSLKVIEYVREGAEIIQTPTGNVTASQMLERFLFPSNMHYMPIEKLSGGEKRRLYLLRILMEAPNVLFLDEPTNDLDIETLTILEDYLDTFPGIVVAVSHDRYFLDRMARRIFAFEGNGKITQYEGGYTDYLQKSGGMASNISDKKEKGRKENATSKETWKSATTKKLKFSYNEQREYETIEADIAALEEKIEKLEAEMTECASNYTRLTELTEEKDTAEAELLERMERWEYLEDLAERIREQG
nr:ABC-F family ATP-binding cassette domain-containing protein [Eubacterium sp.]